MSDTVTDDETRVRQLCEELLAACPPDSVTEQAFLEAQYDKGLAWVQFPEGVGGLGISPKFQKTVVETLGRAGAPIGGAKNPIGYGMCAPAVVVHGTDDVGLVGHRHREPVDPQHVHGPHSLRPAAGGHLERHVDPVEPRRGEGRGVDGGRQRVPDRVADHCGHPRRGRDHQKTPFARALFFAFTNSS